MTESKKESVIRSADDLIIKDEAQKLGKPVPETPKPQTKEKKEVPPQPEEEIQPDEVAEAPTDKEEQEAASTEEPETELEDNASDDSSDDDSGEVDDYGNKIPKAKLYTEQEVQDMIRKRLRDRHTEQTPQQQQQLNDAAKDFKADPNSEETWEVQLEKFVESTISKVAEKQKNKEWQEKEIETQAKFEEKFASGMNRYKDFDTVVKGKPISNAMMMATRSMDDPAAFLYAACKQHPKELERIAQLPDHYAQVASIGRLEERMKKAKLVTTTPKPSRKISGDASDKMPERNIDQLINSHAKTKNVYR